MEIHEDTVAGLALHVTARIAARAKAREVLVYGMVSDLAAGSGLHFVERGTMSIDGVKGELRALSVAPERHLEPVTAHGTDLGTLSAREREVLGLVAEGMSNAAIAGRLKLSDHTAKRHVANILLKLDLPTRAAAAALVGRGSASRWL